MPNRPLPHSWALAPLAAGALLLANVALAADNPYYDENATTGGLHKVCTDFSVDGSDILSASCNKVTVGIVSKVSASVDLKPDIDSSCQGNHQGIEYRSDRVVRKYKCPAATGDQIFETNLDDMIKWDASTGKLSLRKG